MALGIKYSTTNMDIKPKGIQTLPSYHLIIPPYTTFVDFNRHHVSQLTDFILGPLGDGLLKECMFYELSTINATVPCVGLLWDFFFNCCPTFLQFKDSLKCLRDVRIDIMVLQSILVTSKTLVLPSFPVCDFKLSMKTICLFGTFMRTENQ
jgi:hypothetical protein